ncbi:hypothetical protein ACROYT_G023842 [Oculina patagonica]
MTRMNGSGEIRKEAADRIMKVLGTKTKTRIGFWNVRTLYQTGKLAQVTAEMRRYCLHILGVSESRWTGSGIVKTSTGETVLYAGRDDNQHHEGVAIILKKGMEKYLLEWKPINSRLMTARMKGKHVNLSLVQCYAPTNDSDDTTKDSFYAQLQAELEKLPRHDMLVIMGDLNAKVGSDNSNYDRAMGKEGCGTMNENGERLAELCAAYISLEEQSFHTVIFTSLHGALLTVRRGADVGSDHHLVTAYVKLKLRSTGHKPPCNQRFNIDNLKEQSVRNAFITQLRNRFQSLADLSDEPEPEPEPDEVNNIWKQVSFTFTESSNACLGFKKAVKKKKWIKPATLRAIEDRRKLKKKLFDTKSERLQERYKTQYREADRCVKRMARADKRAYIDELASQAENAANRGQQGKVYKITKLVCGKYGGRKLAPVKDVQGRLLTTERDQEVRWAEHFKDVLNRPPPTVEADIQEAETDLDVNIDPPNTQEIIAAIKTLKNNKAPGRDKLNAELFKADPELSARILQPLFTAVWEQEKVPDDWTKVDQQLRQEQAGFRRGRGCTDQLFALRNIIEQCTEWQRQLYINFVDFQKAFDSIHRDSLWRILRAYGVPQKIVQLIQSFYAAFTCSVENSDISFEVNGKDLPMTEQFKYLGSIVRQDGGAGIDIQSRLNKARNTFRMLSNVWRSSQFGTYTKLKIYQSCVLSTLLYGSECWRMLESDLEKLSTFHTKSLRKNFASSGLKQFPTRIYFCGANRRTWVLLLCNGAGGGLAMSSERKTNPSQRQHYMDTRRKAQAWQAQEYMATYSRDRIEGLKPKLEHHPTAGQRQTAVEDLCCCPTCQWAQWAVSE